MKEGHIDPLAEFHMRHPDDAAFAQIAHLITVLQDYDKDNLPSAYRNVSNILGEAESSRILHVMCLIDHVDYLSLLEKCQSITLRHISPRILLHLSLLPVSYVARELEIDPFRATQILDEFKHNFTIDDPIQWLKRFLAITEEERKRYGKDMQDLLMGRAVTNAPRDTHEYKRKREEIYRLRPDLKPPGAI